MVVYSRVANSSDKPLCMPNVISSPDQAPPKKQPGGRRPTLTKGQIRRAKQRRMRNARHYHEALALAGELGIELGENPGQIPDVMERIFRRVHALWKFAASQVDLLDHTAAPGAKNSLWYRHYDDNGNVIYSPSKWVEMERALREELFEMGSRMTQLNIDTRHVMVEEKQLDLLSRALATAAAAAGLSDEQKRNLGSALRTELAVLEGRVSDEVTARQDPALPNPPAEKKAA